MGGSEGSRLLQPVILRVGSAVPALGGPASRGQERPPFVRLTMPNGGDALVPVRAGMNNAVSSIRAPLYPNSVTWGQATSEMASCPRPPPAEFRMPIGAAPNARTQHHRR